MSRRMKVKDLVDLNQVPPKIKDALRGIRICHPKYGNVEIYDVTLLSFGSNPKAAIRVEYLPLDQVHQEDIGIDSFLELEILQQEV